MILLVPADVLHPRRVDAYFAAEADAARTGGHEVALVDHDALAAGRDTARAVARVPAGPAAVYRGWMLPSRRYAGFAAALAGRGTRLRTSPEQYRRGHELPGWYQALTDLTPASVWTTGTDRAAFDAARTRLGPGPAVLRDYTKSMKHHWQAGATPITAASPIAAGRLGADTSSRAKSQGTYPDDGWLPWRRT